MTKKIMSPFLYCRSTFKYFVITFANHTHRAFSDQMDSTAGPEVCHVLCCTGAVLWGCCLNRARTVHAPCAHRASFCVFYVHQIHNA